MFVRLVKDSLSRQPRRKVLTAVTLAVATAMATATLSVALDVGDRMAREFRSLGANLLVTPDTDSLPLKVGGVDYRPVDSGAYLQESDLGSLKTIFWRNNVLSFAPFFDVPVRLKKANAHEESQVADADAILIGTWHERDVVIPEDGGTFRTGVAGTYGWWQIDGRWFAESEAECVVGKELAARVGISIGDMLHVTAQGSAAELTVVGILTSGDREDESLLAPLATAQALAGRPGVYRRLMVSALAKPEDSFSQRNRSTMTPVEFDRWYCSPYLSSIAHQIEERIPDAEARPVRRIAESEGRILSRISILLWLVTGGALLAAALAVAATAGAIALERKGEVGLMKALGARGGLIASLFLGEQWLLAAVGGTAGYFMGLGLADLLGQYLFGTPPDTRWMLLPVVLGIATLVATLGSLTSVRKLLRLDPAPVLRGE
jgi:putative ABC transport system permease protein